MKLTSSAPATLGLVTGTCFAEVGHHVICVDNDAGQGKNASGGGIPIYEPGLRNWSKKMSPPDGSFHEQHGGRRAKIRRDFHRRAHAAAAGRLGGPELSSKGVARDIAAAMTSYASSWTKAPCRSRPAKKSPRPSSPLLPGVEFDVVSNPEFLREGFAVGDLMKPDRIVIGVGSSSARRAMKEIYDAVQGADHRHRHQLGRTDQARGQFSFLALKISYINAVAPSARPPAPTCRKSPTAWALDERIGRRFLNAGIGFGGSCFPKDLSAFIRISEQLGYDFACSRKSSASTPTRWNASSKKSRDTLWVCGQENRRARPRLQAKHRRRAHVSPPSTCASGCKKKARRCASTIPRRWTRPRPFCRT
jgi:UDPglucose 6-dehydrogenase